MNIQRNQKEMEQYAGMTDPQGVHGGHVHGSHNSAAREAGGSVHKAGSRGFSVDFSGGMPGNQAYDKQGKTMEDVMAEAAATDVSLQKDYMTVMSNSMSDEDFAKLSEEGYDPGVMEPEEAVTIVDTIKAELAESGTVIAGYNDDIDVETLKKIMGSEVRAQEILDAFHQYDIPVTEKNVQDAQAAMEMAEQVTKQLQSSTKEDLEGVKKYLLENHLSPVLENLYRAVYSGSHDADVQGRGYFAETTGGYYGRKADQMDVSALQASMEKVIKEAGYEVTEKTLQDAAWMVETGLPLTAESFAKLNQINQAIDGIMQEGRTANVTDFLGQESLLEKAVRVEQETAAITDAAVDKVVADGDRLDLAHLTAAQEKIESEAGRNTESDTVQGEAAGQEEAAERSIYARRQMEEVRLYMSVQVNYRLLKQGISIDTTELSTLVENLKAAEQEIQRVLFGRSGEGSDTGSGAMNTGDVAMTSIKEMSALFQETISRVRAIPGMPASILGELLQENKTAFSQNVTVDMVYETGAARQSAYAAMEERYEPLMTAPMAEYGDSIEKAFRNVDDILQEMHLETTEGNRRAVRILGYNGMELSEENIRAVKETYATVSRVIDKMTPAATLDLIREGVNPLTISMEELENHLADRDGGSQEEMEKYSRYLYRLEQKNEITPEEKESYIGIYRLLHQVEKRDGAAIGSLLNQGAEINFKNLLTAVRNHKRGRMDYQVDDDFGALKEEIAGEGGYRNSITMAIETAYREQGMTEDGGDSNGRNAKSQEEDSRVAYYQKLAGDIKAGLTPEAVAEVFDADDISLEALYDKQQEMARTQTQEAEKADHAYLKEQAAEIRMAAEVSDQAVSMLLSFDMPATLDNLAAADSLLSDRGSMAGQVKKQAAYLDEQRAVSVSEIGSDEASKTVDGTAEGSPYSAAGSISDLLDDAIGSLQEHFTDSVSAKEAYEHLADRMEEILTVSAEQQTDRIDVKGINLAWKQVSVARNMAREECYEIPMEIGGRMTSVNVRLCHSSATENHVTITMETENFGKVSALFEGDTMSGYIVCDRSDGLAALKQQETAFKEEMRAKDLPVSEIKFIQSDRVDINNFAERADDINRTGMSSENLYQTAKTFMKVFLGDAV
ncbi:MAG: hypothetical protein K2K20_12350 [Lachnospiraceae bacterium]|nr:hypothetical protein [Lachnospiraceae bacterium]